MRKNDKRKLVLSLLVGVILMAALGFFVYKALHHISAHFDVPMQKALEQVTSEHSYSQNVETQLQISDRRLDIVGIYEVDSEHKSFAGYSTTSLLINGDTVAHSFTHQNISIGDDIYTRIDTSDPLLSTSIQRIPQWTSFKSTSIPEKYSSIVISGPIQDNLAILGERGNYLVPQKNLGAQLWGNESLLRYSFTLSDAAFGVPEGPLNALVGRVGRTGTVDVWIDPTTFEVRYLVFQNPPYFSTTTVTNINSLPLITPPIPATS